MMDSTSYCPFGRPRSNCGLTDGALLLNPLVAPSTRVHFGCDPYDPGSSRKWRVEQSISPGRRWTELVFQVVSEGMPRPPRLHSER